LRSTVLFVPGLRGHVADHWQTLLAARMPGARTVPPLEQDGMSRAARVANLDAAIAAIEGPVILAAHSAGCLIVAHWAQIGRRSIRGALLATPADVETPLPAGYPTEPELQAGGWLPTPRSQLPFPSILAASRNDPLCAPDRAADLAKAWNSLLVDAGEVGHLNGAAGFGSWAAGETLIEDLDRDAPPVRPGDAIGWRTPSLTGAT
jgi:hypothetical protein